ncbi:hypothetical protein [Flavobacterium beibuense]|uniref:hypothetical protein n=1 Tax=Flavobacterium beibuense TaxID=657326 RepID=UPI003A904A68
MNIKQINSDLNAAKARLEQLKTSTYYTDTQRQILIDQYMNEIQELESKRQTAEAALIVVNNPEILK